MLDIDWWYFMGTEYLECKFCEKNLLPGPVWYLVKCAWAIGATFQHASTSTWLLLVPTHTQVPVKHKVANLLLFRSPAIRWDDTKKSPTCLLLLENNNTKLIYALFNNGLIKWLVLFSYFFVFRYSCDLRVVGLLRQRTLGNSSTKVCNQVGEQHSEFYMKRL